jgi:hypothetical protein
MSSTDTKSLLTNLYPLVETGLKNNLISYKRCIGRFIEARNKELYDTVPCSRTYFGANEIADFFDSIKVDKSAATTAISKTYYNDIDPFNPAAAKDEFSVALLMGIRYFLVNKMQKELEISSIYLAFSGKFYTSIHSQKFQYNINNEYRHVMEYVLNNELSYKFDLKKEGNIFNAIKSICITWLNSYKSKIISMRDEDAVYVIQQLHNRIKSFLGNFATVYYKVWEDKDKYLSYAEDDLSDDNYHIADNDALRVERYVETTMMRMNGSSVDVAICSRSANPNVKVSEVKSIIESIVMDNKNIPEIKELIRLIISTYMQTSTSKDIRGIDFISKSITPKPNTKDPNAIRQKEIIEKWLDTNSPAYRKRKSREATKISYHKSVMTYFVLLIHNVNK